ncbi:MAG: helix-turn-helix domain-containing protein [Spirochaetes bacterium]|nr:helix-turn-helix domain-containing protein [Spirochaetota bacterium]
MSWVSIPAVIMAAVSLYVGFYYFWMFVRRRLEMENLAFAVTCISIAFYDIFCAGLYNAASPEQGMFWQRFQFASLGVFTISVSWFLYYFTGFRSRVPFIVITAWLSLLFVLGLAVRNEWTLSVSRPYVKAIDLGGIGIVYNEVDPGIIYTFQYVSMVLIGLFLFYVMIYHYLNDEKPRVGPIVASMVPFLAASVNDVMVGAGVYPFIYLTEYAYMFIIFSMASVLQNRFIDLHREVEELTQQLEEKVNDRTMELFLSEITHRLYAEIAGEPSSRPPDGGEGPEELPAPGSNLSQDISIITNIDKLLKRSLEKGAEIVGAATSCLFMIDEAGRLDRAADLGEEPGQPWIAGAAERVLWENQPLIMNRHDAEGNPAGPGAAGGRHSLLVPVNLRGKAIGVCCMQRPVALDTFTERDIRIAGLYVSQAASAIENAYLYQRMIDRNVAVRQQSVTPAIEEKMKKAIAYIRENYRSDISREGLAASLNMHPDSFGRFFKVYTNKKISEFINELRVMEAARKLRETNANIIDIAFSVGFESLPTFNRAFLKIMNVTPTKYRGEKE